METISKNDLSTYTSYAEVIAEPLGRLAVVHTLAESKLPVVERRVPTIHDFRLDNQAKLLTLDSGTSREKADSAEDLFVDLKSAMINGLTPHLSQECPMFQPYTKLINSMVKDQYDMEYNFELADYQNIYKFVTHYLVQSAYYNNHGFIPFYRMHPNFILKIINYGISPSSQVLGTHNIERAAEFLFDNGEYDYIQHCPGAACFLYAVNELVANYSGLRCQIEDNRDVAVDFHMYLSMVRKGIPEAFKILELPAIP